VESVVAEPIVDHTHLGGCQIVVAAGGGNLAKGSAMSANPKQKPTPTDRFFFRLH
jgi:hypothetical protein